MVNLACNKNRILETRNTYVFTLNKNNKESLGSGALMNGHFFKSHCAGTTNTRTSRLIRTCTRRQKVYCEK